MEENTLEIVAKPTAKSRFLKSLKEFFDFNDWKILLRSIPGFVTALFIVSVVVMNLLASKVIIQTKILGITGGFLISWLPFLTMDIVVKVFGLKAANKLNVLGLVVNLFFVALFQLVAVIQVGGDEGAYAAFNQTFSQTWQIFTASSIAFLVSGILNNVLNWLTGKLFKKNPNGALAYFVRSYVSTFVGQFIDNFVFVSLAFLVFFKLSIGTGLGYTIVSALGTAALGALIELAMEAVFSPIGYRICKKWTSENVGADYINLHKELSSEVQNET